MKVPLHIVEERRRELAEYLQQHAYAPIREVCAHFNTSEATARRDLAALAARKQIVRTYGGALTEYNDRFPSFRERENLHADAKRKIALAARALIKTGMTCFLDFGTTTFALAAELRRNPLPRLQVVTNNLPVAELLVATPNTRVYLLGGELLANQSALLGKSALRALDFHSLDLAFLSAEAFDADGVWNSQTEFVRLQQKVLARAGYSALCIDVSKIKGSAPAFLAPWSDFDLLITDATARKLNRLSVSCETLLVR